MVKRTACDPFFLEKHRWAAKFVVRPDMQHRACAEYILDGLLDIVQDTKQIVFLRIVTMRKTLKVYYAIEMASWSTGVRQAIDDMIAEAQQTFRQTEADDSSEGRNTCRQAENACVEVMSAESLDAMQEFAKTAFKDQKPWATQIVTKMGNQDRLYKPLPCVEWRDFLSADDQARYPNFAEFFSYLRPHFVIGAKNGLRLPPILLLGEPGVGKTEILSKFAAALSCDMLTVNMAAAQCSAMLAGSDSYWGNSRPGMLFETLIYGKTASPVVFLDEIDKVSPHAQYSPVGVLYQLLERESARSFRDLALPAVPVDASHIIWVAAANSISGIDSALLQRFTVISIPSPSSDQMPAVVRSVYRSLLAREGWGDLFAETLSDDVIGAVGHIRPRDVRKLLGDACANAVAKERSCLTPDDIVVARRSVIAENPFGFGC